MAFPDSFFNPFRVYKRKLQRKLFGVVTLRPRGGVKNGHVLLSFVTHPFAITKKELLKSPHTTPWECMEIVSVLLERGYGVDIIEWTNSSFNPKREYVLVIDIHANLERFRTALPTSTLIHYITGAHWSYQNRAEQARLQEFTRRRGTILAPRRQIVPSKNIEYADYATSLGNDFAKDTYEYAQKKITKIPLLSPAHFPSPENKNFKDIRKNFVWIGGGGAVHKGLDLVLEAFADLPDFHLTVCGPVESERDFFDFYKKELTGTPNITFVGRIDVRGEQFKKIIDNAIGLVYPSSSEGQSGAVVTALHAGLIPIVTYQSGVDVEPFGIFLKDFSTDEINAEVRKVSELPPEELGSRALGAWNYAREHHTSENFHKSFASFIDNIRPLISVIIPAHENEVTIGAAIESILAQTYSPLEIIIVDDNSVDGTARVARQYADKYENIFFYPLPFQDPHRVNKHGRNVNAGYMARNYGLERARGQWITFQDGDDASLRNRIEVEYILALRHKSNHVCLEWQQFSPDKIGATFDFERALTENPSLIISPKEIRKIARHSKGLLMKFLGPFRSLVSFEKKRGRIINRLFFGSLDSYPGSGNSPLFKREVLKKVKFRQVDERVWPSFTGRGADRDFNFQVAETFGKSMTFKLPIYLWRVDRENDLSYPFHKYLIR